MDLLASKNLIVKVISRFPELQPLSSRSMFGGYGLCQGDIMFALVHEGAFYLRGTGELAKEFITLGMAQFTFSKRGRPLLLSYFQVLDEQWLNNDLIFLLMVRSLSGAIFDKNEQKSIQRIKDLPNITLNLEKLLWRVGITTLEELKQAGAIESFYRLRKINTNLNINVLYTLAAALEGCHLAVFPISKKQSLLEQFNKLY